MFDQLFTQKCTDRVIQNDLPTALRNVAQQSNFIQRGWSYSTRFGAREQEKGGNSKVGLINLGLEALMWNRVDFYGVGKEGL